MKFGDYLRQKREENGWTQPEAAARADIEQSYLSKMENGKSYPSEDIFRRLERAYDLDMDELGQKVFSAELDKLREISSLRSLVLKRQQGETRFLRSWLGAGLALLMLGTGLVTYQISQGKREETRYQYTSPGIIKTGEPIRIFTTLKLRETYLYKQQSHLLQENPGAKIPVQRLGESFSDRLDVDTIVLRDRLGGSFVRDVPGGRRLYSKAADVVQLHSNRNNLVLALGAALMIGGLGCFFLSRRWR